MAPAAAVLLSFAFTTDLTCLHSRKSVFLCMVSRLKKGGVHLIDSALLLGKIRYDGFCLFFNGFS